ncbi:nephrocystin-3 [Aplysia californica]|uniref:Nephrocystin-3 n=1 Tax=Aplysia californica TaxID=6500 RepID=A0ABM0K3J3_APLCA|nr:nephrocystin-3 [Aplysia californica]
MGTGSSFMRSHDDEDILGSDLEGTNGVLKRIPIEIKPRGKLGLRSVGSLGRSKPKGGSLRSALSMDLENPEVERIRKDFEMYRLNKDNEIANMQKKEQKLETENKRLRAELLALQKTCTRMRAERDAALEAEQEALARASVFESERDKVQRQFKLFRETKESEIQNLLRAKQELENRLSKLAYSGQAPDDNDSQARPGIVDLGNSHPGDWWATLESEPSLGSTVQLHQPAFLKGPEFASTSLDMDGPFINVNKEDWNLTAVNAWRVFPSVPPHLASHTIRVFASVSPDLAAEFDKFMEDHVPRLCELCSSEGRDLTLVHLPGQTVQADSGDVEFESRARKLQVDLSVIFVAFLGNTLHKFSHMEMKQAHLDHMSSKSSIVLMSETSDSKGTKSSQEMKELKRKVREVANSRVHIIHTSAALGSMAQAATRELERLLKVELGVGKKSSDQVMVCDSPSGWADQQRDMEQLDLLHTAVTSSCEMGFEKYYEHLNTQVSAAGPLPPLLVMGSPGSGKSLLLAKWLQLQEERSASSLLLYHFVGSQNSVSADPILMIRRLTAQLMQQVSTTVSLTCDPVRLVEEFPRWLEKISARSPGGVLVVLDSVDRFQQADVHLKWLLDPLPVDARVIVSVNEDSCPQAWRSWPTLHMEPCSSKHVKELLWAELSSLGASMAPETERRILAQCRTPATCCPLYVSLIARHIASLGRADSATVDGHVSSLLSCGDSFDLYCSLLTCSSDCLGQEVYGFARQILQYIYASRCGMLESELLALIPGLGWPELCALSEFLTHHLLVRYQLGLLVFAHAQAQEAVYEFCFKGQETRLRDVRASLIGYFQQHMSPGQVPMRVVDELPWLVSQMGDKQQMEKCILDLGIFQQICTRGRCSELLGYWQTVGWDKDRTAEAYFTATKNLEVVAGQKGLSLLRVAEIYETLGGFLRDLGLLSQALPALQRALEIREIDLDPDDPLVARSLHMLAGLHAQWGKYSTAETLYRHALEICQNTLGTDHPLVVKELEALAALYHKQDKHDLAHRLRKKAFAIKKTLQTPRSQSGEPCVDSLQQRVVQLEELVMGPDSSDLARSLNELGVLHYLQNNPDTAESFFKRALEMRETILGSDHLDVASSLNNLAALYNDKKLFERAEPLYDEALRIRLKHLPPDNPAVASIINQLARLYKQQSKYDKAEPLYRQAVEIREKSFGPTHPSVATALVNLAVLMSQQNRYEEAEPVYEQALKIYEDTLGLHHPRVAETLRNLAVMKYEQEDFQTAAHYYKRATEIKDQGSSYGDKVMSRRSSSIDTNSTVKNI